MMEREEEEAFVDEEESLQCSSGCQSGWTLYLEHSGSGQQQCCTPPCHPADVRRQMSLHAEYNSDEEEDSMVSDASSGPPHHVRDDEEELLQVQVRGQINKQHRPSFGGDQCCDSGIGGGRGRGSVSGSLSLVSTRTRSSGEEKSRKKRRRAAVQRKDEAAGMNRYRVVDDEDLDDTASSSAVFAPADLVEAMHLQQPSCAFMAEHCHSLEWPAV